MDTSKTQFTIDQTQVFNQSRYLLVNRLAIFIIGILGVVAFANSLNEHFSPVPDLIAIGLIGSCYLLLRKTRDYRLVSKIAVTGASITLTGTLFIVPGLHLSTMIWIAIVVVFAYLMLEKLWGAITLAFHFGALIIYLLTIFEDRINNRFLIQQMDTYVFLAEFTFQGITLGYMLHVFLGASQTIESHLVENQECLTTQNELILTQKKQIEVMLKEIHHRVKNNLQVISSFLKLQSDYDSGEESAATYQEAVNRVNTIALIHEKIQKSETFQRFELAGYVENLTSYICDTYPLKENVRAYTEIEDLDLDSELIVPLAMILNELITNSIRHAFHEQPKPRITIKISSKTESIFEMFYADNGKWVDAEEAFGSEIIAVMTEQLNGNVSRKPSPEGTTYHFELSKN